MSLLSLYQALPYPLRVAAASARGYSLRRTRYGGEFAGALEELQGREAWTPAQWKSWQQERLAEILHRAVTKVPWYRAHWEQRRRKGDRSSWEVLSHWPVLEKEQLRGNGRALVAENADIAKLSYVLTSGTTGTPTELWISPATQKRWYAQIELRCRMWNGVSRRDAWAHLGGKQVASIHASKPPYWVWNYGLNQLYLSSYHLRRGRFAQYAEAMEKHGVRSIIGYSSALYELAHGMLAEGVKVRLQTAITEGEPVFDFYRETVRQAFGCELRESYGMVEIAAAGSECSHGTLHSWPDTGIVETVHGDQAVPDGTVGDFLCTGLLNAEMPLIRYRNGDRGVFDGRPSPCGCGRSLPPITSIEGRISDVILTADGRRLSPAYVEIIYDEKHPIAEAQLVQHTHTAVTLRFVPLPEFDANAEKALRRSVHKILGDMDLTLEPMEHIPRGPNGKLRAVLCLLPADEIRSVSPATAEGYPSRD